MVHYLLTHGIWIAAWILLGIYGYIHMYCCEAATKNKPCEEKCYVLDAPIVSFVVAIICAPIAFAVGWVSFYELYKYARAPS